MAEKNGEQEFKKGNSMGKIESMVLHVTDIIESFRQKHKKQIWNKKRSTRGNKIDVCDEKYDGKYVIAMDNYFTLPEIIKALRDRSIGVVGTARFKQSWPPKELKQVPVDEARFNDFYWTVDEYGTLLGRWMDNNFVFCVSTVHRIGKVIERIRRKPRMTAINKSHVEQVWGSLGKIAIYIPQLIDDYNHWMGGVDLADQRIAYYQPDLRCRRNWIPIFIQMMSIIRNNAYHVYKDAMEKKGVSTTHKSFTLNMIRALLKNAHNHRSMELLLARTGRKQVHHKKK